MSKKTAHDTSVRQWRRHIVDVAPYEEERYSRQGICTTVELFLRAGDQLVLAFHSDANGSSPAAEWRCDLWSPEAAQSHWLDVPANGEMDVPVTRPGEYLIGIGQAYGHRPGVIGLWLRVSEPDRLALPLEPAFGSTLRYARRDDGAAVVHIEDEAHVWSHARLETLPVHGVPAGSALLFASADDVWDVSACSDPCNVVVRRKHPSAPLLPALEPRRCADAGACLGRHALRSSPCRCPINALVARKARCVCSSWCVGRSCSMCGRAQRRPIPRSSPVPPMAMTAWNCGCSGRLHGARNRFRRSSICACGALIYSVRTACVIFALENAWVEDWYQQLMPMPVRAVNKTTALTARRAWPVLGIGMYHASTAVLSALSAPT